MNTKLFNSNRLKAQRGQSTVEFAFMFPIFLVVFIGLAAVSLLFFSYVTAQLAVREGANSLVRDPTQTIYQIRTIVCNNTFALDSSQISTIVNPSPKNATLVPCTSLDSSEGAYPYILGTQVAVSVFYNVPLPTVSMPTASGGPNTVLLGPIQIYALSVMTVY